MREVASIRSLWARERVQQHLLDEGPGQVVDVAILVAALQRRDDAMLRAHWALPLRRPLICQ